MAEVPTILVKHDPGVEMIRLEVPTVDVLQMVIKVAPIVDFIYCVSSKIVTFPITVLVFINDANICSNSI